MSFRKKWSPAPAPAAPGAAEVDAAFSDECLGPADNTSQTKRNQSNETWASHFSTHYCHLLRRFTGDNIVDLLDDESLPRYKARQHSGKLSNQTRQKVRRAMAAGASLSRARSASQRTRKGRQASFRFKGGTKQPSLGSTEKNRLERLDGNVHDTGPDPFLAFR